MVRYFLERNKDSVDRVFIISKIFQIIQLFSGFRFQEKYLLNYWTIFRLCSASSKKRMLPFTEIGCISCSQLKLNKTTLLLEKWGQNVMTCDWYDFCHNMPQISPSRIVLTLSIRRKNYNFGQMSISVKYLAEFWSLPRLEINAIIRGNKEIYLIYALWTTYW